MCAFWVHSVQPILRGDGVWVQLSLGVVKPPLPAAATLATVAQHAAALAAATGISTDYVIGAAITPG